MEKIVFYSYPSCTSCRKTKKWLREQGVSFQEKHLFKQTPSVDELKVLLQLTTSGVYELLATKSKTYQNLSDDLEELPLSTVLTMLSETPQLLRRPILTDGKKLVIGYDPSGLRKLAGQKESFTI